ncbi:HTTM domain-containing protein [Reichenbachiella agariperforans]|uniref:HTTM domain-containing protein n=1 Tax=Reichenbachiella agariperforans TaxID=156994 RepID=UPI00338E9257
MTDLKSIWQYQKREVSNAPLVLFRMAFGILMTASVVRFMINGWVEEFYLTPSFHFSYYAFEWVQVLPKYGMHVLFALMLISAVGIALGLLYRISTTVFFLSFTYVELIDQTYYLNHYYFVSLIAFLLIWLPAGERFSVDAWWRGTVQKTCRFYEIAILRFQVAVLYCFAGIAKLNPDWLLKALPLKIWLPANSHLPIIGALLTKSWVAYFFSWFGALYDLTIPFFLSMRYTRWVAYCSVIVFHALTALLFPIGMFPYVMILSTLIFFPSSQQEKWLSSIERKLSNELPLNSISSFSKAKVLLFVCFVLVQLAMPWRYLAYPGSVFWHEQGYRFSWRVMLMEKMGQATFYISDGNRKMIVDNSLHLTPQQEKMMATQPDMILQYAHHLKNIYKQKGMNDPKVTVDAYVTLNGRRSKRFIEEQKDLSQLKEGWKHKDWVLSYE